MVILKQEKLWVRRTSLLPAFVTGRTGQDSTKNFPNKMLRDLRELLGIGYLDVVAAHHVHAPLTMSASNL
jgi:hypothetical protein